MEDLIKQHIQEIQNEKVSIAHRLKFPLRESEREELKKEWNELDNDQTPVSYTHLTLPTKA